MPARTSVKQRRVPRKRATTPAALKKIETIKAAAVDAFYRNGYAGTDLGDVARAVGLHPSSLYNYFSSKEEILYSVMSDGIDAFSVGFRDATAGITDPVGRIRQAIHFNLSWASHHRANTWVNIVDVVHLSPVNHRTILKKRDDYQAEYVALLTEGIRSGVLVPVDAKLAILGVTGLVTGLARWDFPDGPWTPDEMADSFSSMLFDGLCVVPGSHSPLELSTEQGSPAMPRRRVANRNGHDAEKPPARLVEIRAAAAQLFHQFGYNGTDLRLIADKVGVDASSFYNYIDTKQELLYDIIYDGITDLNSTFDEEVRGAATAHAALSRAIFCHMRWCAAHRQSAWIYFTDLARLEGERLATIIHERDEYDTKWQRILAWGVELGEFKAIDVKMIGFGLLGMLWSLARWYKPSGSASIDELARTWSGMAIHGLRARGEASPEAI